MALPEICARCHRLLDVEQGEWTVIGRKRTFICFSCREKSKARRETRNRSTRESPAERSLRIFLSGEGFKFVQEYKLGKYCYDFAFPSLNALIEVDSRRYHSSNSQLARDRAKDEYAKECHWTLIRVKAGRWLHSDAFSQLSRIRESIYG